MTAEEKKQVASLDLALEAEAYKGTRKFLVTVVSLLIRLFYRPQVEGLENIPSSGPYYLVGNHQSLLDVLFVHPYIPQNVNWLAKGELFCKPIVGEVIRRMGAIPVDREGVDVRSVKACFSRLRANAVVGLFPEATRIPLARQGQVFPKNAVVELLARPDVPILPFAIQGPIRIFRKTKIVFGKCFELPVKGNRRRMDDEEASSIGRLIMEKIYSLIGKSISK